MKKGLDNGSSRNTAFEGGTVTDSRGGEPSLLPRDGNAMPPRGATIYEVRQSALIQFELCGEAYRRRYIAKEQDLAGTAALRGRAVHYGAQVNHAQKVTSGRDLPKTQILEATAAAFDESKAKDGFRLTREEMGVGVKPTLARTLDGAVRLAGLYADELAPSLHPRYVEQDVAFELHPGADTTVRFGGRLDLADRGKAIHDLKTSGRRKSQADVDDSLQGSIYWLLYRALTGEEPTAFVLDVLVDSDKGPFLQKLGTQRTSRDLAVLVNRVNAMIRSIQAGVFTPAAVGSWKCSEKFCSHWESCAYVNSERKAAAVAAEI
jgi:hypothetical protein